MLPFLSSDSLASLSLLKDKEGLSTDKTANYYVIEIVIENAFQSIIHVICHNM